MQILNFENFAILLHPVCWIFAWAPIAGFIKSAYRDWKSNQERYRRIYTKRERWMIATPLIVILEMSLMEAYSHATHAKLTDGFFYLFWSLFPLTIYFYSRFRHCQNFAVKLSLAQIWLALWVCMLPFMD